MLKMMISDVDDTLLRNSLSDELKTAVKLANESGVEFVLCSGRPTFNLRKLAAEFNQFGANVKYVSGFNGSEIIDLQNDQVIKSNGFTNSEIDEITKVLLDSDIDYGLYQSDTVIANNVSNEYAILEAELNDMNIAIHDSSIPSNKILGFSDPQITDEKVALLKQHYPHLQINKSKPFFIEITKPGVNKALPVKVLSELLNIDFENVAVCGDGDNDLAMFELDVAYKFVVANGSDNLKRYANKIIPSVDDNGVAKQLMELI
ncbi:Cof-type HAD-IIB family hydrolase [Mollicutes bacterium LVI A0039]|nr:Cof-type HAD-IIB family hydrolase [Mollicutes bacterium LVI A0039]